MGRKRERRTGDRADSSQTLTESDRKGNTTTATVLLLFLVPIVSVIVYRILHTPSPATPDLPYVYRRGLVADKIDYHQVLHVRFSISFHQFFLSICLYMLSLLKLTDGFVNLRNSGEYDDFGEFISKKF